jgi:hypothetical protein
MLLRIEEDGIVFETTLNHNGVQIITDETYSEVTRLTDSAEKPLDLSMGM